MYSHSSYSDVWPIFFSQSGKFLKQYRKVVFSDTGEEKLPDGWDFISYNDDDNYAQRMTSCLKQLDTPLVFLHHEDMPLFQKPDYDLLDQYESIVESSDIDFIRLLRGADSPGFNYKNHKTLYSVPSYSPYFFAVQPSIFKTDRLVTVYNETKINSIGDFEPNAQAICRKNKFKGLFHYDRESKRGAFHYDSKVYPYICTAVVKGKWNLSEYKEELTHLLEENGIEYTKRGSI